MRKNIAKTALLSGSVLLTGPGGASDADERCRKYSGEYERQLEIYYEQASKAQEQYAETDRQLDESASQLVESARQAREVARLQAIAEKQLDTSRLQAERMDRLLRRWEGQADRYDRLLELWESQAGSRPGD